LAEKYPGGEGGNKKRLNYSKKDQKIALLSLFQGGRGQRKKDQKIAKKSKNLLLSLYLLYLYHV